MDGKILKILEELSSDVKEIKIDVSDIKQKVIAINEQTADLTEFRTETRQKLEKIENGIEVLGKEDFKNKVELVEIKRKLLSNAMFDNFHVVIISHFCVIKERCRLWKKVKRRWINGTSCLLRW